MANGPLRTKREGIGLWIRTTCTKRFIPHTFSSNNIGVSPSGKAVDSESTIQGSNPCTPAIYIYQPLKGVQLNTVRPLTFSSHDLAKRGLRKSYCSNSNTIRWYIGEIISLFGAPGAIMWDYFVEYTVEHMDTSKANTKTKIPFFKGIIADRNHNRFNFIGNQY